MTDKELTADAIYLPGRSRKNEHKDNNKKFLTIDSQVMRDHHNKKDGHKKSNARKHVKSYFNDIKFERIDEMQF